MSYGLEVKNSAGNLIVDDIYKNFQVHSYGIADAGDTIEIPISSYEDGGLVFGRPYGVNKNDTAGWHIAANAGYATVYDQVTGVLQPGIPLADPVMWNTNSNQNIDYSTTAITSPPIGKITPKVEWVYVRPSVTGAGDTDYGLEVYAPDGSVSFSSGIDTSFDIVGVGQVGSAGGTQAFGFHHTGTFGTGTDDPFDYWICMSNLLNFSLTGTAGTTIWGWAVTGKWTKLGGNQIIFYQPFFNFAGQNPAGLQFMVGKFRGDDANPNTDTNQETTNNPPVYQVGMAASYNMSQNVDLTLAPVFTDPEGGGISLSYSTSGTLGGATVTQYYDPNDGRDEFLIEHGTSSANFNLTVTASDGYSTTSRTTTITYTVSANNNPPVYLGGVQLQYSLVYNNTTNISPLFGDADGDSLTIDYFVTGSSGNCSFSMSQNGSLTIFPNTTACTFQITFTATDPSGAQAQKTTQVSYSGYSSGGGGGNPPGGPGGGGVDP